MRKSRWMLLAVIAVILFVCTAGASSCGSGSGGQVQVTKNETREIAAQVLELERAEPVARPKDSAELRTQNAYYTADADPDKLWYVTLIALDGTPYMHFTVRGAPAPAGDEVTNPEQLFCQHFSDQRPDGCGTIGLAEPNGIYQGSADPTFIARSTTGSIMRFPCGCVVSDQPFTATAPVRLAIDENAAVSHTNTSLTNHAYVPSGTSVHR